MKVYLDSSAYAKRFIEEAGSQRIDDICQQASAIFLSIICFPEVLSALNRRVREKNMTGEQYALAKTHLSRELIGIEIINIIPQVVSKSGGLLENHPLRALDAMDIACAIE